MSAIRKEVDKTKADEAGLLERLAEESKVCRYRGTGQAKLSKMMEFFPAVARVKNFVLHNVGCFAFLYCLLLAFFSGHAPLFVRCSAL